MIRAVIVDDEQLPLQMLEQMLNAGGLAKVEAAFTRPLEALDYLRENKVDAVFLDIEMPDMGGMELAGRILDVQGDVGVVFVTAYNQYAVEAFRLNALDYLLKPVSRERLQETLYRILEGMAAPALTGALAVRCFGKFTVRAGAQEIRFRTEKAEELLAFLIDSQGGYVSRNKILDSLWEDFDGDRAIVHLNSTLHNVKKALLPYGVKISILYDRGSYRLDPEGLDCDYLSFSALLAEKAGVNKGDRSGGAEKNAAGKTKRDIGRYEAAAALYTGDYLSGWEFYWAAGQRIRLEEQYTGLLLEVACHYRDNGDYRQAAGWLKAGLSHAPLHRELNYRLIEALLLANERMLAVQYFELYQAGLLKRLGVKPDEAFLKLL